MRCDLISLLLTLSLGVGSALAQVPDPMRPPAGALTTPEASVGTAAPVASGVQTVILRSAGKDNTFRALQFGGENGGWHEFGVHPELPHAPGNKVGILGAKVEDQNFLMHGRRDLFSSRALSQEHRGSDLASLLVLPLQKGMAQRHEVRAAWVCA